MNANEARELTTASAGDQIVSIRATVDAYIERAAKESKKYFYYFDAYKLPETVREELLKSLKDDGYTVRSVVNPDTGNPCNRNYFMISW